MPDTFTVIVTQLNYSQIIILPFPYIFHLIREICQIRLNYLMQSMLYKFKKMRCYSKKKSQEQKSVIELWMKKFCQIQF